MEINYKNKVFLKLKKTGILFMDFRKPLTNLIIFGKCFTDCKLGLFIQRGNKQKKLVVVK